ncbi:hypothetical protein [Streptomyces sp. S.PNR 29]|uniref:hypothetical protein n=1 Tax=Streptomyces sp. S.PNR 29 TaxID=2973805 RepID=UPI0025AF4C9E|nr:hypothetical protein [Streptomyces sp. S.PNR 29]MDN0195439.1 hypothetical protein [Streptomyces sp. S.PNR 29]
MPVDQHSDPFEDRLAAALRDTGGAFDTDRAALAAAGRARGRRLRLRRRAAVVGGAAGLALVGVGGAVLVPDGDEAKGPRPVAAGPTAGRTAPGAYSADRLIGMLKEQLPEGRVSGEHGRATDAAFGPYAHLVYDDGKGPGAISVSLNRVEPGSEQARQATRCPDKAFTPYDSCVTSTLSDGSKLMLLQGYEYPDRRADTKWWNAALVTPAGQQVSVSEWNSAAEKDEPVSRPEPPLSAAELKKLVTAPEWRAAVDAIPEDPRSRKDVEEPSATPAVPDGSQIARTLADLVPGRAEVVAKGGEEGGFGYVVVDDGKGASLVQINVQPGMSDVAGELFGSDAETLQDGTRVRERQGPGEKGGGGVVMWTVDTLRTDGFRVVVSAFNSGAQNRDATRAKPALTMDELRRIALSPNWR